MSEEQHTPKRGCLRFFLRGLLVLGVLLAILIGVGWGYEQRAKAAFFAENPPPGELVDIGGRSLHLYCVGSGSPTVILDAGQGGWSIDYMALQGALATTHRTCTYDRAGYGWSDPAEDERTLDDIVEDLHTLASNADIDTPYILVGFSFSGLTTRLYTERYGDDLAGAVLIDPAHEDHAALLPDDITQAQQSLLGMYSLFENLARVGVVRLLDPAEMSPYAPFIVESHVAPDIYYGGLANADWWATSRKEFYTNQFADLPDLPETFSMPVHLIGLTDSIADERLADINVAQIDILQSLADNSDQVSLTVLDGVSHENVLKEVDVIAEIIREMGAS